MSFYKRIFNISWPMFVGAFLLGSLIFIQNSAPQIVLEVYYAYCLTPLHIMLFILIGQALIENVYQFCQRQYIQLRFKNMQKLYNFMLLQEICSIFAYCCIHRLSLFFYSCINQLDLKLEFLSFLTEFLFLMWLSQIYLYVHTKIVHQRVKKMLFPVFAFCPFVYYICVDNTQLNLESIIYPHLLPNTVEKNILILLVLLLVPVLLYRLKSAKRMMFFRNSFNASYIFLVAMAFCKSKLLPSLFYDDLSLYVHDMLFTVKNGNEVSLTLLALALLPLIIVLLNMMNHDSHFEEVRNYLIFRFARLSDYYQTKRISVLFTMIFQLSSYILVYFISGILFNMKIDKVLHFRLTDEIIFLFFVLLICYDVWQILTCLGVKKHLSSALVTGGLCLMTYLLLTSHIEISFFYLFISLLIGSFAVSKLAGYLFNRKETGCLDGH